jgi:hypothetical protein
MIIYNVTVNIDDTVHHEWLMWMKTSHIPKVIATGSFTKYRILRVLPDDESEGCTYSIQYYCKDLETYHQYQSQYAEELQKEHMMRFRDKFVAFRTLLEEVD